MKLLLPTIFDSRDNLFSVFFAHPPSARNVYKVSIPVFHTRQVAFRFFEDAVSIAAVMEL